MIQNILTAGHYITRILEILRIPRATYYRYMKWQLSPTAIRRQSIKEKVLQCWLKYPMYGYPRLMILVNKIWQLAVGPALIYRVMRELGIQSRMVQKRKKPKTYTEVEQRPNLIKKTSGQNQSTSNGYQW
ncbi:transposase [Listeria seeligeri]|uniref:Transposase n=1 Tax=Listeria seeligeri TaxID=1640 RepID=A0A7X1C6X9_LISSE|nr:IS3 family transposase [Listeria seeligeri]MBC1486661.1 transposase [Listeria seeligeri]MBC1933344.1 transposase [Listeria seeligeri]